MEIRTSAFEAPSFDAAYDVRVMSQSLLRRAWAGLLTGLLIVLALVLVPFAQWGLAAWHFVVRRDLAAARRAELLPARTERALRAIYRRALYGPALPR